MGLKVLMLGWELPPYNSGGLGVACLGLARSLANQGAKITFVLPKKGDFRFDFMKMVFADVKDIDKLLASYTTSGIFDDFVVENTPSMNHVRAAILYGERVGKLARKLEADVIHSHDWLTFPGGMAAKEVLKKPLVTHVHSTEYDRTGGHFPNPNVHRIEGCGLKAADRVITVSEFTKNIVVQKYGIEKGRILVVHNGIEGIGRKELNPALKSFKDMGYKIVLYLGRITLMKGPEYFVYTAKRVLEYEPKVIFVVVGSGDMQEFMMNEAGRLGIMENFLFTGFLRGDEKDSLYQAADLYVMPSVSEPFGITALEAIANGTSALISKQSGVSEVLNNVLKVDFWDIDEMTNKILAVLKYPPLKYDLTKESVKEIPAINWDCAARKCMRVYSELI